MNIAVIGLGYVGLNLAVTLSKQFKVIGFDINKLRIKSLNNNLDITGELKAKDLKNSNIIFSSNIKHTESCKIFIITVPTPIYRNKKPDLRLLKKASIMVGKIITKNSIVVYESTVYPGVTEDYCIPILTKVSGLKILTEFNVAYSPERINPSDKIHKFENLNKIVASTNKNSLKIIHNMYQKVIKKTVFKVNSIKVAEAAKVIENAQRDINIAFINELSIIFDKMKINTNDVLNAAATKWNFLDFKPGLVGGHCIGVDPYYLTYAAKKLNYQPNILLSGRNINDNYSSFISKKILINLKKYKNPKVCILGATFKENCKDLRNSKVFDVFNKLKKSKIKIKVCDPVPDESELKYIYKSDLIKINKINSYTMIILLVPHKQILSHINKNLNKMLINNGCIFDLKNKINKNFINKNLKYFSV